MPMHHRAPRIGKWRKINPSSPRIIPTARKRSVILVAGIKFALKE